MILNSICIKNFKCVSDSGRIIIDPGVTCLVGKNESGKTAILEALYRLNPIASGHRSSFNELYDYPRRKRAADREIISTLSPCEAEFELDEDDVTNLEKKICPGIVKIGSMTTGRKYNNHLWFDTDIQESRYIEHLINARGLDNQVAHGCSTINDLIDKIEELTDPPEALSDLLDELNGLDLGATVRSEMPKFLYFNEYSTLPGRVSIPYLQSTAEDQLGSGERTALAFLRLAGVDTAEFVENQYEPRKAALEAAAAQISDEVFEFWSQNKSLRIELDVDFGAESEADRLPPFLEIRVYNDRHRVSLNFGERSTGFVWFFSFLAYFSEFRKEGKRLILLLDEPGLGLHASAQADLLRFIDERLAPCSQVIYSTHSPFMIKSNALQRVRTVEDRDEVGTVVSEDVYGVSRDTIFPLQAALGYELSQSLFVKADNLVVEGPSDILYMQILSEHLRGLGRSGLDARWALVPAGGIDKIPTFVALLGTQLNLSVVTDGATGSNQRLEDMVRKGLLKQGKWIPLTDITGGKQADIEDLFEPDFYLELLVESGVGKFTMDDLPQGGRIVNRIEQFLGCKYDHYQPAFYFLKEQAALVSHVDSATVDRFERLFERLNSMLS